MPPRIWPVRRFLVFILVAVFLNILRDVDFFTFCRLRMAHFSS